MFIFTKVHRASIFDKIGVLFVLRIWGMVVKERYNLFLSLVEEMDLY